VKRIAIGPSPQPLTEQAVRRGGGELAPVEDADGLVWLDSGDAAGLEKVLTAAPGIRWVQLPAAGVERFAAAGLFADGRTWTCAKGSFAKPVAEHALMLALAGLRQLPTRIRARSWGPPAGETLLRQRVLIVGGGGIATELLALLAPFNVDATVVRRSGTPLPGAARVIGAESLPEVLPDALVVFLALALTPSTTGIIGGPELSLMNSDAWLVNVARGPHVVTDDLVSALRDHQIGGAALDVTDPEPLPDDHPLWTLDNAIITPHTADTPEMVAPLLAERIAFNVAAFANGTPMEGLIDPQAGYLFFQRAQVGGHVDRVLAQRIDRHDLQCPLVRRRHDDRGRHTVPVGAQPVRRRHAPAVAGHQPGEPVLRHRGGQIVADVPLVLEELRGHHRADRVAPDVLRSAVTASVAVKAGQRVRPAWL
jgi:phosphoglycerate dehydrogenase-like enzyme